LSHALPTLYLVRHGETAWTVTGQHTGRTDLPLNGQGERQARDLRAGLAELQFGQVLVSPLRRARQTAELALPGAAIEVDPDLCEWGYGDYEGKSSAAIQSERPGWQLFRDGCPGGETLTAVGARAERVIDRVRAHGGNVLLVAHRDILRILAARWVGLSASEGCRLQLGPCSLSSLGYDRDLSKPVIQTWNRTGQ
jgi:probable phosphoglycerate mutase